MNKPERKQPSSRPAAARRTARLGLFPAIQPYSSGFLDVGTPHTLYWEQSGNPDGVPVVLLHGGPGAGSSPAHRRFFNPDHYRIVIFDQRGAGRSQPLGCTDANTLPHLVADMETIRKHLRIDRWHLFGGSWGSTLALAYAQAYPDRCRSLILRGIFLMEREEIDWFMTGINSIFPEAWDQFADGMDRDNLLEAYYTVLNGPDHIKAVNAAISWSLYESACSSLLPNFETITTDEQKAHALAMARIEAHYFRTQLIAPKNSLLNDIDKIRAIPAVIVQGRYDMICPIRTAHRLHAAWPEADYIVVPDGGHSSLDPAIRARLIEATENAKTIR
jgi:proline iminopeptidase